MEALRRQLSEGIAHASRRAPFAPAAFLLLAACHDPGAVDCDYARPRCPPDRACARVDVSRAACIPFATEPRPILPPFSAGHAFWCAQGPRSAPGRTHSASGDLFAADLASLRGAEAGQVIAPVSGDAYVFDGCAERDASPSAHNDSRCGLGYGNHVKIWDGANIYLLGHLSRVLVGRGRVARGQVVGVEGVSGAAGHRHVHLTVTRPGPRDHVEEVLTTPGYKGSIPVRFRLSMGGGERWVDELRCEDDPALAERLSP